MELGYQIIAISPDKVEKIAEFNKKGDYAYRVLSDATMEAARAFGLAFNVEAEVEGDEEHSHDHDSHEGHSHD